MERLLIEKTKALFSYSIEIKTGRALKPYLTGFRGKKGRAVMAVEPRSVTDLYRLIQLYRNLNVGFILQGANTSLKGQSTPNIDGMPVVIIRTIRLKKFKVLDYPGTEDYKILLVEPGLSLKEAEHILDKIGFDLPHKIGSHDFGNTFGASCATGCGGVRVDNRDGRASLTEMGNMGVVSISTDGLIYNGFIKKNIIQSGQALFARIDANNIDITDIELPKLDEIERFMQRLFVQKSYPIRNQRGHILFAGDGGEGSQAIVYQMYLIRKKPTVFKTYVLLFHEKVKTDFYQTVIFSEGPDKPDSIPILCESMSLDIVKEIVQRGVCYPIAWGLALAPKLIGRYTSSLFSLRKSLIHHLGKYYIHIESFLGQLLAILFTPKKILSFNYSEMLVIRVANRTNGQDHVGCFEKKLKQFMQQHPKSISEIAIQSDGFLDRLMLEIREASALATLTIATREQGTLIPCDDAIMPGKMSEDYAKLFFERLNERFPHLVMPPYFYGHDLKQISHNDWILKKQCTTEELHDIHQIQHDVLSMMGGFSHAEHGLGDYALTDLDREGLIKLVAHRMLNDKKGLANPGGSWSQAFLNAIKDQTILDDAETMAIDAMQRELARTTLLTWEAIQQEPWQTSLA